MVVFSLRWCRKLLSSQGAAELPRLLPVGGEGGPGHTLEVPPNITKMLEPFPTLVGYHVRR